MIKMQPQEGYQMQALTSSADIVIGGGAAGAGKTWTLLADASRGCHVPEYGAVIFRRTGAQIKSQGGLWDASTKFYGAFANTRPVESKMTWYFNGGKSKVKFNHMEYEKNMYDWQGSEIPFIGFDELTHFSKKMFFYLLSRNRSTCGFAPVVRATCNPDPDSWVRDLIDWWIGEDGYPIPERSGVIRYFMIHEDNYIWGDTRKEVIEKAGSLLNDLLEKAKEKGNNLDVNDFVKSITFISGSIFENKELLKADPGYLGSLNSQTAEEKHRLLDGNWNIKKTDNDIYDYMAFKNMFSNHFLEKKYENSTTYITSDIAGKGSDKFVTFVWRGKMLIDFVVQDTSKGNDVIDTINQLSYDNDVVQSNISFDNDGLGWFVDGFIEDAKEFTNNARALEGENYKNLKSQCFFRSGDAISSNEYYIPPHVANKPFSDTRTLKEQLMYERKAIKRDKPDYDGKLAVIPKQEMKVYLQGKSPDALDAFSQREFHDITPDAPDVDYYY